MSYVICYVDDQGNVKYEESDKWENTMRENEDEMHGFQFYNGDDKTPWEDEDLEASEWLEKHNDEIRGLEAAEAMANGKGDTYRPVDKEKYDKAHIAVFGDKPKHVCRKFVWDEAKRCDLCYFCGEPEIGKRK